MSCVSQFIQGPPCINFPCVSQFIQGAPLYKSAMCQSIYTGGPLYKFSMCQSIYTGGLLYKFGRCQSIYTGDPLYKSAMWLLAGRLCSRTQPPKTLCQPCAGGGALTLCRGWRSDLVPGGGAKPCAQYLCEHLVPGTFAVILIKLHHSATACKNSAEIQILRHVFEARYYQVL